MCHTGRCIYEKWNGEYNQTGCIYHDEEEYIKELYNDEYFENINRDIYEDWTRRINELEHRE